jgi:hypothetical protein
MHPLNWKLKSSNLTASVALLFFLFVFTVEAFSESKPNLVKWPNGFDFFFAIKGEDKSLEEFQESYLSNIVDSHVEDTYGLALANLTLGLVDKDPFYIVIAKSLFAANSKISTNPKEKELSEFGLKYAESILSGKYPKGVATEGQPEPIQYKKYRPTLKGFSKNNNRQICDRVQRNAKIKTVDRVTRDWLQAFNINGPPGAFSKKASLHGMKEEDKGTY